MSNEKKIYDVVIIGGGPAGSTLGSYLAKNGVKCAIFEKENFPRPHVGESLVPSSTRIFKEIDFLATMERENFPKKYGALWTSTKNTSVFKHDWEGMEEKYQIDVQFKEREQEGVEQNYTYHVDRAKFDYLLLHHANRLGCDIYEEHRVKEWKITSDGAFVSVGNSSNEIKEFKAKILVDASGRNTFIGSKKKWKVKDPVFDQFAVHCWFEDYTRSSSEEDNITIHFLPKANSWIWQIPITNTITSIGIVAQKDHFKEYKNKLTEYFWDTVSLKPEVEAKLQKAKQVTELKMEGDYSYAMKEIVDDRLILIGDAARFVDPIFSSGVSIALQSAKFASEDIISALSSKKFDKKQFSRYNEIITRGCKNWHEFITLYYRLNVMFTYFLSKNEYRQEVLKFLQGDVYNDDKPKLLDAMQNFVEAVENNPKHPLHDYLGSLTANRFKPT